MRHCSDIIIKPADKGNAIAIMDKANCITECHRQFSGTHFCESTDSDFNGEVIQRVNLHVYYMLQRCKISYKSCSYLTTDIDRR